ncbi:MAG: TolC family protein, partial [Gammaproteobacteria bacterium]
MSAICSTTKWISLAAALLMSLPLSAQTRYSLDQAVARAQQIDPWLRGSELREQSMLDRGVAAAQLPDPRVSINMANLPTDSFDFGQEPMTQLQVGVSQVFPRGEKRSLESRQFRELSERQPLMRADRKARVAANVTTLWLDAFLHAETIRMLEQDRTLFENLVDVVQSRYANSLGKTRQQDLVRAQLELTRLEDRIARTQSQKESSERMLAEWLYEGASDYPGFAQIQLT